MSQANIDLLREAWAAYDRGDAEAFRAFLTDDWRQYGPRGAEGGFEILDDQLETMQLHRVAFPDKRTDLLQVVADDETVACYCTCSATHTGTYFDLEPTGKRVVVYEMMFSRIRDGRLAETWAIDAGAGFYEQIAGRPAPGRVDNLG